MQPGTSIPKVVTGGNLKLCCHGLVLELFESATAIRIDSE